MHVFLAALCKTHPVISVPCSQGLDILTPLGRGMSFLVIGPRGTGKTTLGLDAILAQNATGETPSRGDTPATHARASSSSSHVSLAVATDDADRQALIVLVPASSSGVRCIYASVATSDEELGNMLNVLRSRRALENTAILSAPPGASIGEQLATISAACSLGGL